MSDEDEVEDDGEDDVDYDDDHEELCAALRSNDPDTTEIFDFHLLNVYDGPSSIPQYGRRLGEALQGNQYVSSMDLDLDCLLDDDKVGPDSISLLL